MLRIKTLQLAVPLLPFSRVTPAVDVDPSCRAKLITFKDPLAYTPHEIPGNVLYVEDRVKKHGSGGYFTIGESRAVSLAVASCVWLRMVYGSLSASILGRTSLAMAGRQFARSKVGSVRARPCLARRIQLLAAPPLLLICAVPPALPPAALRMAR